MGSDDWNHKLDEIFKQYNLGDGSYCKNYANLFDLVNIYDGMNTAIKNGKRRMAAFDPYMTKPSAFDPGTTVYELAEELQQYMYE